MSRPRQPKQRVRRKKKQVTVPWKRRALAKLKDNEKAQDEDGVVDPKRPINIEQLRKLVKASKKALNVLFDLDRDPPQLSNDHVDEITGVLGIAPPLLEEDSDDDDLAEVVHLLRTLTRESRQDVLAIARRMPKK